MVNLDKSISDKAQAQGYPNLDDVVRDMKQADVQKLLSFLINELAVLTVRIASLEKNSDKIN